MKVFIFSDIHGDLAALNRVLTVEADIYICAGDLATFSRGLEKCGEILEPLKAKLWLLPGNHESHRQTRELCEHFGFLDFHRRLRVVESPNGHAAWAGLGYSNVTPFHTPGEYSEEEIAESLRAFENEKPIYLVAHCPPHGTKLDEYEPGKHAGSTALRKWVDRVQPEYLFCGHIHETAGLADQLGSTHCINVGKQGYMVEF